MTMPATRTISEKAGPRRLTSREHAAYHEAGHAMMALDLCFPIIRASIVPDEETVGHVAHVIPRWLRDIEHDPTPYREVRAHHLIMISLAGAAAVAVYRGREVWDGTAGDVRQAHALAACVARDSGEAEALTKWLWIRTRAKIAAPTVWPSVEALGQALLAQKQLTGRQCITLHKAAQLAVIRTHAGGRT